MFPHTLKAEWEETRADLLEEELEDLVGVLHSYIVLCRCEITMFVTIM